MAWNSPAAPLYPDERLRHNDVAELAPVKGLRVTSRTLVVLGVLLAAAAGVTLALRAARGINVILITVDTLRADHLGAYGYKRHTSPNLDALAKESVLFQKAFAQSSETNPSLSSLMTSALPSETRVLGNRFVLPKEAVTLAGLLRTQGYRTGAVVSNFSLRRGSGFEQGFEVYDDQMDDWSRTKWEGMERIAPKTTTAAIQWLNQHGQEHFFLWVHYMDPHFPYLPPTPYKTMFVGTPLGVDKWLAFNTERTGEGGIQPAAQLGDRHELQFYIAQYDGEIRFFDEALGKLLTTIQAMGLLEKTMIILVGDHGEGMGEHNYYFAHHEFLYQGLIHVPLLVRFPDHHLGGTVIPYPVANVDILPTVLETLRIAPPKTLRGRPLLSADLRDIYAVTWYRGKKSTLMFDGMKLIESADHTEFYDLSRDPEERHNLGDQASDEDLKTVGWFKQKLAELNGEDRLTLGPPAEWNINAEAERKLRVLGYVQ